jgi:hypothetical protein
MKTKSYNDRDAFPALQISTQEVQDRYWSIRNRMKLKVKVTKEEVAYIKKIRCDGRELQAQKSLDAFERLFVS